MSKELFSKWRKSPDFRRNIIIGVIAFILITNFTDIGKKEGRVAPDSICNQFNGNPTISQILLTGTAAPSLLINDDTFGLNDMSGCLDSGCIAIFDETVTAGFVSCNVLTEWALGGDWDYRGFCSGIGTRQPFLASSQSKANKACSGGPLNLAQKLSDEYCGFSYYRCFEGDPSDPIDVAFFEERACDPWMEPFADFLDSIWDENNFKSCSSKAYLVMFGAGLLLVAFI